MTDDQIEDEDFTCPECSSHYFGTSSEAVHKGMTAAESLAGSTGHCHGYKGPALPCTFTWPRSEDARYFTGNGRFRSRTAVAQGV